MHEWIPVVCGVLLACATDVRVSATRLTLRAALLAILIVVAAQEWSHAWSAIALDMVLIGVGLLLARAAPRVWMRLRTRRVAVRLSD
jgi:hypothetical protein